MEMSFWQRAAEAPDAIALYDDDGTPHSAAAVLSHVHQLSHALRSKSGLALPKGSVVACLLPNCAPFFELVLAVTQSGLYLVPLNWHLAAPEIAYILSDSQSEALFYAPEFEALARSACNEAKFDATRVYCVGSASNFGGMTQTLIANQPTSAPKERSAGACMQYTSGTTGRPKGVKRPLLPITPDQQASAYAQFLMLFDIVPNEGVHLVGSPLYHTAVLNFATWSLHLGHTVAILRDWSAEKMLSLIESRRVTHTHMVPTQFVRLLNLPESVRAKYDTSSMRQAIHSAAPCPVEIKHRMLQWWGPCIYEYYAATEGGGTLIRPKEWLDKPGSVGKAWPGSRVFVLDEQGNECPVGAVGTVYMQMGTHRFEYHKDSGKTSQAFRGDAFTVGDAGYLDADEYLFLVDRKIDMIISGGVNIYPAEIEGALLSHPVVQDAAVFGIPHADWGEQVHAVVELQGGHTPSSALGEEIVAWLLVRLAKFKCPKRIEFVSELPRDPNGKLKKRLLRDPHWKDLQRSI